MTFDPWKRVAVDEWEHKFDETLGSDGASWLVDPDGKYWLHKDSRIQPDGHVDGEDWAEVSTTVISELVGIPCAPTRLCTLHGKNGSLSLRINDPQVHDFREGGLLLEDYGVHVDNMQRDVPRPGYRTVKQGHSLETIRTALREVGPPESQLVPSNLSSFDVFAGYLCLDAFVANRDRHEQNWAVLEPTLGDGPTQLAPSFDHGSALAYNLQPDACQNLVTNSADLERWLERGTAHRIQHTKPPGPIALLEVATQGLRLSSSEARRHWIDVFCDIDFASVQSALAPGALIMSERAHMLILKILETNRRRFRDAVINI